MSDIGLSQLEINEGSDIEIINSKSVSVIQNVSLKCVPRSKGKREE